MSVYVHICHVTRLIPFWFVGHIVVDELPIVSQSLERDVRDGMILVIASYYAEIRTLCRILGGAVANVTEIYVFDTATWSRAVFAVIHGLDVKETALANVFNANIIKGYSLHHIVVATIDADASLIVNLWFGVADDVDILVTKIGYAVALPLVDIVGAGKVALGSDAVNANHDGVSHISPKRGVAHDNIVDTALETFACCVGCGTVVTVATEDTVVENV